MIERIIKLFEESGKSIRSILLELNLSPSAFNEWKRKKSKPTLEAVKKIAVYFDVSLDYLLGLEEKISSNKKAVTFTRDGETIEYELTDDELSAFINMLEVMKKNK